MPHLQLVLLSILGIKIEVGNWALWAKPGTSVDRSRRIVNSTPAWDTQWDSVSNSDNNNTNDLACFPVEAWDLSCALEDHGPWLFFSVVISGCVEVSMKKCTEVPRLMTQLNTQWRLTQIPKCECVKFSRYYVDFKLKFLRLCPKIHIYRYTFLNFVSCVKLCKETWGLTQKRESERMAVRQQLTAGSGPREWGKPGKEKKDCVQSSLLWAGLGMPHPANSQLLWPLSQVSG